MPSEVLQVCGVMQVVGEHAIWLRPQVVPPRRFGLPMVAQTPRPMMEKQHSPTAHWLPVKQSEPRPPSGRGGSPPSSPPPPVTQSPADVSQT